MRRKLAMVALIAMVLAVAGGQHAGAQDVTSGNNTVTATVLAGSRSITIAGAVALAGSFGGSELTGSYAVTVVEAARAGTNPWTVQASITDLTRAGDTNTIPNSNITLTARDVAIVAPVKVGTGSAAAKDTALSDAPTSLNNFSAAQPLFRIKDQAAGTAYSGTYNGTGSLAADVTNVPSGTYTGTVTYSLVY